MLDDIVEYIKSDFVGLKTNRKSTEGYVFMLAGAALIYLSKLQSIVIL